MLCLYDFPKTILYIYLKNSKLIRVYSLACIAFMYKKFSVLYNRDCKGQNKLHSREYKLMI